MLHFRIPSVSTKLTCFVIAYFGDKIKTIRTSIERTGMGPIKTERPERLLHSIRYTSEVTGLCYRTIWRYAKEGKIKAVRCGSSVLIPADEVKRICKEGF